MLNKIKNRKEDGFTIIEVLIVLAIAGLIMLIVFLAVPALQRNSRNTQRTADASKVAAAVANCMSNRNGTVASCDTQAELEGAGGLDTAQLQQLTTIQTNTTIGAGVVNTAGFAFASRCAADGATVEAGQARQAAVTYRTEVATGTAPLRCLNV